MRNSLDYRRSLLSPPALLSLVALLSVGALGCGDPTPAGSLGGPNYRASEVSTEPAPELVVLRQADDADLDHVGVEGTLAVDKGCIYLDGPVGQRSVVAWPYGTSWDGDNHAVERNGGIGPHNDPPFAIRTGDYFSGAGTFVSLSEAFSFVEPDRADALDSCAEGGVALFFAGIRVGSPPEWVPPTTILSGENPSS